MEDNDHDVPTEEMEAGPSQTIKGSAADSPRCNALEPKHRVFLSHSCAQKDFVEQLCTDLERWQRFPFFDKRRSSLPIGERFPGLIFDAIQQCHVGVLILSREFFEKTKWPMVELVAMVKELKNPDAMIKIVPVFYHISREEWLDSENRCKWMSQWEKWAGDDERIKVDEWKEALEMIQPVNSLVMNKCIGELKCREVIVKEVCKLVLPETRWDDSHVQGRLRLCKIIHKKIGLQEPKDGVQVMGLYGMGGIGKTTICKAMCNEVSQEFHGKVCHVELNSASEVELLREALRRLTDTRHELLGELNVDQMDPWALQCRDQLKRCVKKDPVFLAIDNVSNNLEAIRQAMTYLGAGWGNGSVLIVTARSLGELTYLNQYLDESECLRMPELEKDEATSLFLSHVCSGRSGMVEMDEGLVSRCVERCYFSRGEDMGHHYIPLALQVLGEQFGCIGYDAELWDAQLKKIEDTFDMGLFGNEHPIFSILRSSFDSLVDGDKMLLMDVALLLPAYDGQDLVQWYRQYSLFDWLSMVHGSTVDEMMRRLEGLKRRSLLGNLGSGMTRIGMHDLWREFCVAETKVEKSGGERWLYVEEGCSELGDISPAGRCRERLKRMCFLNEGWRILDGEQLGGFVNVSAMKLEIGSFVAPSDMELDLTGMKQLKSLELKTVGFSTKCVGFESLRNLVFLWWKNHGVACIPCMEEIGRLTKLQVLVVMNFDGGELPDLSMLASLRVACFPYCFRVVTIRGLCSKLSNLRHLDLGGCSSLQECPGVGQLYALEVLSFWGCSSLRELPCLRLLTKLRVLLLDQCKLLRSVPGLRDLVALEEFSAGRSGLGSMPDTSKFTRLTSLGPSNLPRFGVFNLVELHRLVYIYFAGCSAMKSLACERPLGALKEIDLNLCSSLEEMPDLAKFPQLEELRLGGCSSLMTLTCSKPLYALKILNLEGCSCLRALPDHLGSSVDLRELRLQQSGIVLSGEEMEKLEASCKRLVVFPSASRSEYGQLSTGLDVGEDELDDVEIHAESGYQSRRLPDSLQDMVRRLVYLGSGDSLLALTSNGIHKLWDWGEWSNSEAGYKLWRHSGARLMINDINDAKPGEGLACMASNIYGSFVISASGGNVSLFHLMDFEVFRASWQLDSIATSLAFTPHDLTLIAIGMEDSTILIVKIMSVLVHLEVVYVLTGHQKRVTGLAFSKTLSVMVSLGADAQLCMWRTGRWMKQPSRFAPLEPDAKSPCLGDIRVEFHSNEAHVLVVGESQLAVYDALKLDCLRQWVPGSPYTAAISDAVFSCDSQQVFTSFVDGSVGVFDGDSLEPLYRIAPPLHTPRGVSGLTVYPLAVAAHPLKGSVFALGLSNGDVLEIASWCPSDKGSGSGELSGAGPRGDEIAQVPRIVEEFAKKPRIGNLHLIFKLCIRVTWVLVQVFPVE